MRIDVITLFPEMMETVLNESIIGRAQKKGVLEINCHQLREFAFDKHRHVDDAPYGGGKGMLMMTEPIALCYENICESLDEKPYFVYMSPQGNVLNQQKLIDISSKHKNICVLCGHYEGVDQRVIDELVDEEISIGDYVLTGGELPTLVFVDALARMEKGVLSEDECFTKESHYDGLLEYPQYTRPQVWRGKEVPQVLLSGHHENVDKWRREQSVVNTAKKRPDMIEKAQLTDKERALAQQIIDSTKDD
ncbi:MAG: tRNA (guanosine(37)-N1)-methyltransferase TrmD [Ruminococcus sp.]|nr:tRNA (guanosine(37)-N1)-methyltransferase TrmD [Ruminococcus sp.]